MIHRSILSGKGPFANPIRQSNSTLYDWESIEFIKEVENLEEDFNQN